MKARFYFFIFLPSILALLAASQTVAQTQGASNGNGREGELHLSLGETHKAWLVPSMAIARSDFSFGSSDPGIAVDPIRETSSGLELGLRLLSGSNHGQTFLVGLDLRQVIAQIDSRSHFFSQIEDYETRLGIRGEWRPNRSYQPAIGAGWFFGDTIVMRERDLQFNGHSFMIFSSFQIRQIRVFLEGRLGSYQEGPGFIFLPRRAGPQTLSSQTITIGAEWPFEVSMDGLVNGS